MDSSASASCRTAGLPSLPCPAMPGAQTPRPGTPVQSPPSPAPRCPHRKHLPQRTFRKEVYLLPEQCNEFWRWSRRGTGGRVRGRPPAGFRAPTPIVGDIALPDFIRGNGQVLERKILDQEFAFGFYMHYMSHLDISLPAAIPSRIWVDEMVTSGALRSTILAPGHFFIRRARA